MSFVGSLLVHGLFLAAVWRSDRAPRPPPPAPIEVSVNEVALPARADAATHVAVVGARPSGPGRAMAGSNPRRRGTPEHAPRFQPARGRANGPGRIGRVEETVSVAPPPPAEPEAPAIEAPPAPSEVRAVMLPPAPSVDAERSFDALARAQLLALSRGNGGGQAGSGSGRGGIGVGLATELSGRAVEHSSVAIAPVLVDGHPIECELPDVLFLRAVVRVLVTREGVPAVPRLLQPSGHQSFDGCALRYVLAMRFAPGMDGRAQPVNVWMNVQVMTVSANQVGSPQPPP